MKLPIKKFLLLITAFSILGLAKSTAACFNYTNNTSCKLELQIFYAEDCEEPHGVPDVNSTFNLYSTTLPANSTTLVCPPLTTASGCPVIITGYFMKNPATGEVVSIAEHDPNGLTPYSLRFLPSFKFDKGDCINTIYISQNPEDGSITFHSDDCPKFCFRNETGCWNIEIFITIEGGDNQCKDGFDTEGQGAYLDYNHLFIGDGSNLGYPKEVCTYVYSDFERNCKVCPGSGKVKIWVCPGGVAPCVEANNTRNRIKCDGVEFDAYISFENGVYVIRKY